MKIAIIGGGAAGYFSAINIREMWPAASLTIYESSSSSLAKVKVSGGGRCNLTNTFESVSQLTQAYPRGAKLMKSLFRIFDQRSTVEWFENRGVALVAQADDCVFPVSQSSQEIVDLLEGLAREHGVVVKHSHRVELIRVVDGGYELEFCDAKLRAASFDRVVVATGGSPKVSGLAMLRELDLRIEPPVPSLFSFNIADDPITQLMGAVVEGVELSLSGSRLTSSGTLLITHWGLSGPAVLRLSSLGARVLSDCNYDARLSVNWVGERHTERVLEVLQGVVREHGAKLVGSRSPFGLPSRLWGMLLSKSGISLERRFAELGSKGLNRLVDRLTNDCYTIRGQSRFREEFVTCGGVSLSEVDFSTMELRRYRGLYLAGEVLDVDAITGGFNLQAAWSMGYALSVAIAGESKRG